MCLNYWSCLCTQVGFSWFLDAVWIQCGLVIYFLNAIPCAQENLALNRGVAVVTYRALQVLRGTGKPAGGRLSGVFYHPLEEMTIVTVR